MKMVRWRSEASRLPEWKSPETCVAGTDSCNCITGSYNRLLSSGVGKKEKMTYDREEKEGGTVFTQPDHTYREIQERSFQQWLNEMETSF